MSRTLRTIILAVFITFAFSITVAAIVRKITPDVSAEPVIAAASEYFLRLENDEIVVYKNGESINTGIAVPELRQQDRLLLESGMNADTYEEVLKLIEDFSS